MLIPPNNASFTEYLPNNFMSGLMVKQLTVDQEVVGSNPICLHATIYIRPMRSRQKGNAIMADVFAIGVGIMVKAMAVLSC